MMAVDINGRFLTQAITGVQRYAVELVRAIDRQLAAEPRLRSRYTFRLVTPRDDVRPLALEHIASVSVGRLRGHGWEQFELPRSSGDRLLINLCNTAPLMGRTVVTIHDASVFAIPAAYSTAFRLWYRTLLPLLGRRALKVLTISEFSKSELSRWAGISASKMVVIYPGSDHILDTPADLGVFGRLSVEPGRYVLAVGSRSPHKNIETLVAAMTRWGREGLPLVLAGGTNARVFSRPAALGSSVQSAGYLTDGELRALYEQAQCFAFPSLYEGFGLPPLEAMRCGCPTVVSRAAALPEVCGDASLYADPHDPDDLLKCFHVLQDTAFREDLRRRGTARAQGFSWEQTSDALLKLIGELQAA
jgi:glycosyltransferase involved in cell wall biosynthesis